MENNGFKNFISSPGGKVLLIVVMYILFFAIEFALLNVVTQMESGVLIFVWWIVMGIFGWQMLKGIQPNMFVIGTTNFWIAYFIIKAVIAALIGIFVAPYYVSTLIIERIE